MKATIRKWKKEDAAFLAKSLSSKAVLNNLRDGLPYPYTEKDGLEYINAMLDSDPNDTFAYAIDIDGKAVGSIGAFRQGNIHRRTAELGYYLGEEYWGQGIMTDAVKQLCQIIFSTTDILRIFAEPYAYNVGSQRVLEKAGFTREGVLRANAIKNNQVLDMVMYSITKKASDYPVRRLNIEELPSAAELCKKVFMQYEAPVYSEEGVRTFLDFLSGACQRKEMKYYGAFDGDAVIGVIAIRPPQHISLFFVDSAYQGKGIGKALFQTLKSELENDEITVNSSPYAVKIYQKLGFEATDNQRTDDGIIYTPMKFRH